jgi:hypothetical protein
MMKSPRTLLILSALLAAMGIVSVSLAKPAAPTATKVVQQFTDYLKSLQQFSYHAHVTYDEPASGGKQVVHSFNMDTDVHRPDRLRVNAAGDEVNKEFVFNGHSIVLYDKTAKVYGTLDVPPNIEAALAKAHNDYNLKVALTDLASPKLYEHLSKNLSSAKDLGTENVAGMPCYHLTFNQNNKDVQLWIDTGQNPLLRKLVIAEKTPHGAQRWTAVLSDWDISAKFDDNLFTFLVPPGVKKIKFLPAHPVATTGQISQPVNGGK